MRVPLPVSSLPSVTHSHLLLKLILCSSNTSCRTLSAEREENILGLNWEQESWLNKNVFEWMIIMIILNVLQNTTVVPLINEQFLFSDMMTSADRCSVLLCTVLVWLTVCSPALVLDLSPHWGQEECSDEADWSQYEVMHCLQNQCPQLVETGSFRTSWHKEQQDGCSSTETLPSVFLKR